MTNQQPAYGVNMSQPYVQPYNQPHNYNGQGYAQQVYPAQPVYNQPMAQPYGQVQAPVYYQQPNHVIVM